MKVILIDSRGMVAGSMPAPKGPERKAAWWLEVRSLPSESQAERVFGVVMQV